MTYAAGLTITPGAILEYRPIGENTWALSVNSEEPTTVTSGPGLEKALRLVREQHMGLREFFGLSARDADEAYAKHVYSVQRSYENKLDPRVHVPPPHSQREGCCADPANFKGFFGATTRVCKVCRRIW